MNKIISVFSLVFLSAFQAKSADYFSEFLFIFPTQNLQQDLDYQIHDFNNGPMQFSSADIHISADPQVVADQIVIKNFKVSALVQELAYSELIQISSGSWSGMFLIEAQCASLAAGLAGEAVLKWDSQSNTLTLASWNIDVTQTQISTQNCRGVNGFESYLVKALNNPAFIQNLIQDHQGEIKKWLSEKALPYFNNWQKLGSLSWKLDKIEAGNNQLTGKGWLYLNQTGEGQFNYALQPVADIHQPAMVLPKTFLQVWLKNWLLEQTNNFALNSDDVPAFKSLMRSRFLQFFVWPELMTFPKSTVFSFKLKKFEISKIETPQKNKLNINASLSGEIVTEKGVRYLAVNWELPLSVDLGENNGEIKVQISRVDSKPEISVSPSYSVKRSSYMPTSQIQNAIRDQMLNKSWNFALPKDLLKGLQFESFEIKNDNGEFLLQKK
jgi:hypothetical protein